MKEEGQIRSKENDGNGKKSRFGSQKQEDKHKEELHESNQ